MVRRSEFQIISGACTVLLKRLIVSMRAEGAVFHGRNEDIGN